MVYKLDLLTFSSACTDRDLVCFGFNVFKSASPSCIITHFTHWLLASVAWRNIVLNNDFRIPSTLTCTYVEDRSQIQHKDSCGRVSENQSCCTYITLSSTHNPSQRIMGKGQGEHMRLQHWHLSKSTGIVDMWEMTLMKAWENKHNEWPNSCWGNSKLQSTQEGNCDKWYYLLCFKEEKNTEI